jgi:hypothetical protein
MSDWITTAEAALISGYHPKHVRRLILTGKVKGQKFGPTWQVSRASLLTHIRKTEQLGAKRGPKAKA